MQVEETNRGWGQQYFRVCHLHLLAENQVKKDSKKVVQKKPSRYPEVKNKT